MDHLMPKFQREISQKNDEICRLQQELSYLLHQNELLRKKVDDDEKAELKVNRILLENYANAKEEILFLREVADSKVKEVEFFKGRSMTLQQDFTSTVALLDKLSIELSQEIDNSKFQMKFNEFLQYLKDHSKKILVIEPMDFLESQDSSFQVLKEIEPETIQNEDIESQKMELKEQIMGHPNASDLEKQIENMYQEVVEKDNRLCEMSLRIKALETMIEKNQSVTADLEKQVVHLQAENSELSNKLSSLEHVSKEIEDLHQQQLEQVARLQHQKELLGIMETEKELLASSVTALEQENVNLSAKLRDITTSIRNEMLNWNFDVDAACLIQGNEIEIASFSVLLKRATGLFDSTSELQQKNRQLHIALEELFKDKAKLKEQLQQMHANSAAMECDFKKKIESLEQDLRCTGVRPLDEDKDSSFDEEKENVAPLAEVTVVEYSKEKTSETDIQLGRGRVKSLQEKYLALTLASQTPLKENIPREPSSRRKLWDDNDLKRSPFVSRGQQQ